jgi:hypothetical protein
MRMNLMNAGFLSLSLFFKDCPKLRWVSLLGKYLHDKWTPERLYDEYPEAAHLISLKPRAASNEAPGEKEVLGVDRLKYDYEGFIQLFSFPRPASYGDESMDPSYYDVHDDRPANWVSRFCARYQMPLTWLRRKSSKNIWLSKRMQPV